MLASIVWRITRDISVDLLQGTHQNQNKKGITFDIQKITCKITADSTQYLKESGHCPQLCRAWQKGQHTQAKKIEINKKA
jgi:hypothetical protein